MPFHKKKKTEQKFHGCLNGFKIPLPEIFNFNYS